MRIAIPLYFLTDGILGENRQKLFDHPEGWIEYFGNVVTYDTDKILKPLINYFMNPEEDPDLHSSCAILTFYSLSFRYFSNDRNSQYNEDTYISWNYKFKKVSSCSEIPTKTTPFTVLTIADKDGKIEKNLIYGPTGEAMYCIDFDAHGNVQPGHIHCLTPGNLTHKEGRENSYSQESIPWVWLAVSWEDEVEAPIFKSKEMGALPYEILNIYPDPKHVNPIFKPLTPPSPLENFVYIGDIFESVHMREETRKNKTSIGKAENTHSGFFGTVKTYAPYLAALGIFLVGHKVLQRFEIYEGLGNIFSKRNM